MLRQLLMIILLFGLSGCSVLGTPLEEGLDSVSGEMDISGNTSQDHQLVPLRGEWLFYWDQLLQPEDIRSQRGKLTGYIPMPSNWNEYQKSGSNLPRTGYATLVLNIKLDDPDQIKGLIVPVIYSNYRLWIDDQQVAVCGEVGKDSKQSIPQKLTNVVYFHAHTEQVQIVLQISNFHNYAGGMGDPILFGSSAAVQKHHELNMAEQYLLLGILFLSGVYHVGLSFFRKKDYSVLLFGLFCLSAVLRNLLTGEVFLTQVFPNFPWAMAMKIEYISMYWMAPLLALFIQQLFPEEASRKITRITIAMATFYSLFTLMTKADMYYRILIVYQLFMVIALFYALVVFIRAVVHKKDGAMYALIGFSAIVLTALHDIVRSMLKDPGPSVYSLGVTAFIICFSFILSKKLSVAYKMSEKMSQELIELNEKLDKKVYERTLAIEESNKKLAELNLQLREWSMVDGLTGVANRRHFDEYLSSQLHSSKQEETALTLLLIDVDFFKLYNDTYGHTQGDVCLQKVVQAIRTGFGSHEGLVARYGGEEFAVVLSKCDKEKAKVIANRMCELVQHLRIPHKPLETSGVVTISIGAVSVTAVEDKQYQKLIHLADQQLYKAKSLGKNRVCIEGLE